MSSSKVCDKTLLALDRQQPLITVPLIAKPRTAATELIGLWVAIRAQAA